MRRAVDALDHAPVMVLVDGNQKPKWPYPCRPVIGSDALSLSIAAASIIAKVTRDRMMIDHAAAHPGYGWRPNKASGTPEAPDAMRSMGPHPLHARPFALITLYPTTRQNIY